MKFWAMDGSAYIGKSKLKVLLGEGVLRRFFRKTVVDFGCGSGDQLAEIASSGAQRVVGLDIREQVLSKAREKIAGMPNAFAVNATKFEPRAFADFVVSLDSFEHFADPAGILDEMHKLLRLGGSVLLSFGPPWLHPLGGHSFSNFPWAHLVTPESVLCARYNKRTGQSIRHLDECSGGLNRMTIRRFEKIIARSPFTDYKLAPVPISPLRWMHSRLTREFTTSIVRCELVKN